MSPILYLIADLAFALALMYAIGAVVRRSPNAHRWVFDHFAALTVLYVTVFVVLGTMAVVNRIEDRQLVPWIVINAMWVAGLVVAGVTLGARREWMAAVDRNEGVVRTRDGGTPEPVLPGSNPAPVSDVRSAVAKWTSRWERYGRSVNVLDHESGLEVHMERDDKAATLRYQADGKLTMSFSHPAASEIEEYEVSSPESVDRALHYFGQRFAESA